ncbi:hypothetical protein ACROYT_G003437 [Oculina patagonica]
MAELLRTVLRTFLVLLAIGCVSAKRTNHTDERHSQKYKLYFHHEKVEPKDLPDTNSVNKQYVYLVAKSDDAHFQFHKEARILLSYRDGMVFIQTDKPIYTPGQTVRIRVIPLDFDMKPSKRKNPKGNRVQQWKDLDTSTVLPKFSIKLSVPPYILKTDRYIKVKITARYTYKEPVVGAADVRLSIRGLNRQVYSFAAHQVLLDRSGAATIEEPVNSIHDLPGYLWFPENWCLLVQADVVERATGNRESVVDKSYPFKSSPYLIQFKNTPKYFKPGLPFVVKVVVTYPNKQPARSLPMKITAIGINGNEQKNLNRINSNAADTTNEYGEAELMVDTCRDCHNIKITVKTDDQTLSVSQNAVANFVAEAFHSGNAPLIMLRQVTPGKVGWKMDCECFRSGDYAAALLSCAVVSRGRILFHYTIDSFDGVVKSWSFLVTPEMSPLARLIVYYIDSNERVVSDSILLKIEESLPTKVDFPDAIKINAIGTRVHLNEIEKIPGQMYEFRIKAPQGTRLGLLGVDESVYLSRNEDRLTKERIFKTAKELDLGCGAGGGKDSQDTFKNAGVVLMTNSFVSDGRKHYGCDEDGSRKKRSLFEDDFGVSDTARIKAYGAVFSRLNWNLDSLVFVEGGKPENPEKNSRSKDENQQQTQTTYGTESRNRDPGHIGEGERFQHCAITAPYTLGCIS